MIPSVSPEAPTSAAQEETTTPKPASAVFQEALGAIFTGSAPLAGAGVAISAQLLGLDTNSATAIGSSVTASVQASGEPAAFVSVQGTLKSAELSKTAAVASIGVSTAAATKSADIARSSFS